MRESKQHTADSRQGKKVESKQHTAYRAKILFALSFFLFAVYYLLLSPFMADSMTAPGPGIQSG